jgi:TPR repeat protein
VTLCVGVFGGCAVVNERDNVDLEIVEVALTQGECSRALDMLKPFIDGDDLSVKYLYGRALLCLSGIKQEEDVAFQVLADVRDKSREKANLGDVDAQYRLAHMYSNASSLLLEIEEARIWAEKAAKQGHVAAAYELSQITQGDESFRWLEYSASRGYNEAQWAIGNIYANGDVGVGIEANKEKAFKYYKEAAESGFSMAFYDYAIDLMTGDGGVKDTQEGEKWMLKAADSDDIAAIKFFVNVYRDGYCDIKPDIQRLQYWEHRLKR